MGWKKGHRHNWMVFFGWRLIFLESAIHEASPCQNWCLGLKELKVEIGICSFEIGEHAIGNDGAFTWWLAALIGFCPNFRGSTRKRVLTINVFFLKWQFLGCGLYPVLGALISTKASLQEPPRMTDFCNGRFAEKERHIMASDMFFSNVFVSVVALGEAVGLHSTIRLSHWECLVSQVNTSPSNHDSQLMLLGPRMKLASFYLIEVEHICAKPCKTAGWSHFIVLDLLFSTVPLCHSKNLTHFVSHAFSPKLFREMCRIPGKFDEPWAWPSGFPLRRRSKKRSRRRCEALWKSKTSHGSPSLRCFSLG